MAKGLTEYLLKFILGVILVAFAFFAMKKAYNEASTKIMEYLGFGDSRYVKLFPDSEEELKLKEISIDSDSGDINEDFVVEVPSGDKFVFVIESFKCEDCELWNRYVVYSVEYHQVGSKDKNTERVCDPGTASCDSKLEINTNNGCLKLKISGIDCSFLNLQGYCKCSGTVKVELELTSSSC